MRDWVSAGSDAAPDTIRIAPLDPRLQVPICGVGWTFDFPYASRETVRARCETPSHQLFLRLVSSPPQFAPLPVAAAPRVTPATMPVKQAEPALALRRDMARGTRLNPDMLETVESDDGRAGGLALRDARDVAYMELARNMRAGQTIRTSDLRPSVLVQRGQSVMMKIGRAGAFQVEAQLEALQDGHHGDRIRLKNRESGRIVDGRVVGENAVLPE